MVCFILFFTSSSTSFLSKHSEITAIFLFFLISNLEYLSTFLDDEVASLLSLPDITSRTKAESSTLLQMGPI